MPSPIKVIGLGSAGGNAVNRMCAAGLKGVEFIVADSEAQDLRRSKAEVRIQLGETVTKGLGTDGYPAKGRAATLDSEVQLQEALSGAEMVFVIAGMGGGIGTGGAPIVAKLAKAAGALTIGVVTRPFRFEGILRANLSKNGIQELRQSVDSLLVIPNDRLFDGVERDISSDEAFRRVDDVMRKAVQALSGMISTPETLSGDLNDLRAILKNDGNARIGVGEASGASRATKATQEAMTSFLLENGSITGATDLLINIAGRKSTPSPNELTELIEHIKPQVSPQAEIKVNRLCDESMGDSIRVTVIASGFPSQCAGQSEGMHLHSQPAAPGPQSALRQGSSDSMDWSKPAYTRIKPWRLKLQAK
jgi:cell division protein FtsZ